MSETSNESIASERVSGNETVGGLELAQEGGHRRVPFRRHLRQASVDDQLEFGRTVSVRIYISDTWNRRVEVLAEDIDSSLSIERGSTRNHMEQHRTQRVDVGPGVHALTANLFRRHEPGRTEEHARLRQIGVVKIGDVMLLVLKHLDKTKVENLYEVVCILFFLLFCDEHDVAGLEIAVDHAPFMGRAEGATGLDADHAGPARRQPNIPSHNPR